MPDGGRTENARKFHLPINLLPGLPGGAPWSSAPQRDLYVYLTEEDWCAAWETGGAIPINPASTYRADVDVGTFTRDEVLHRSRTVPEWAVGAENALVKVPPDVRAEVVFSKNLVIWPDGTAEMIDGVMNQWHNDAHILSLSTVLSTEIMERLGKKACMRILDLAALKRVCDQQLGADGRYGLVEYTHSDRRDHFTKGTATAWQHEYRIAWNTGGGPARWVLLPGGLATRVL